MTNWTIAVDAMDEPALTPVAKEKAVFDSSGGRNSERRPGSGLIGDVEGRHVFNGDADVIVTDSFPATSRLRSAKRWRQPWV